MPKWGTNRALCNIQQLDSPRAEATVYQEWNAYAAIEQELLNANNQEINY